MQPVTTNYQPVSFATKQPDPATYSFRYLPPARLRDFDAASDPGLTVLLQIQALIEEDEGK